MRKVAKIPLPDAVTDRAVSPLVDRFNETIDIPILQGRLLERVDITEGTTTKYRHGLGRKLRGWIIVKSNITDRGLVYDKQDDNCLLYTSPSPRDS